MSTELRLVSLLRAAQIKGWRRHQNLPGKPDLIFRSCKLAVFVDGCFWHGCPHCARVPRENTRYWGPKLARNVERDKQVSGLLRSTGWHVIRIWEHQLERPNRVLRKLAEALNRTRN